MKMLGKCGEGVFQATGNIFGGNDADGFCELVLMGVILFLIPAYRGRFTGPSAGCATRRQPEPIPHIQ